MSNSSLVNYKKISPNRYNGRNHKIDTITIHCVCGQCSVETLGSIFAPTSRQASSNYGIGYDGRIGMYVEEKDAAWTSSSYSNDNRAITIEVASDTYAPYKVNATAYNALIKLLVDICKRNGIKELKWKGDKSFVGQVDKQNMTAHRWFANTACPGDYLYNRFGQIAREVNEKLGVSTSSSKETVSKAPVIYYKVKSGGKWSSESKNLASAGKSGQAITNVAIKVSKGKVKYSVHVKGGKWLPWVTGYNTKDSKNGYSGNGKAIDAIQVYYTTPSDLVKSSGYYKAKYRVSPLKKGFYSYQYDTEKSSKQDGYAGAYGVKIDRLQLTLSK